MLIQNLLDRPELIDTLAQWFHTEWGYLHDGRTVDYIATELRRDSQRDALPTTWVATEGNLLFGTYTLIQYDMDTRQDFFPWLASVYVNPQFRKLGVGTRLVKDAMTRAQQMGIKHFYLFTSDQSQWYAKMGWKKVEETVYKTSNITIMDIAL